MPVQLNFRGKLLFQELVIFGLVQVFGLWTAFKFFYKVELAEIKVITSLWQFIIAFVIATIIMIIALRFVRGKSFFRILFFLVSFLGAEIIFSVYLPGEIAIALAFLFVLFRFVVPRVLSHNLTIIFGLAGVGAAFGLSLPIAAVLLILFLLSIYDYIAVYKTKIMVTMFKELVQKGTIFAAIMPEKFKDWFVDLARVKPGSDFVFLGTGDMLLPLIFSVSAIPYGLESVVFSVGGSLIGLVVLHVLFTSQRKKAPMPALPPIVLFAALGFVISLLIK